MLHEFERKTKVSCYMMLEDKEVLMLHRFGRKTKVSYYMVLERVEYIGCVIGYD